jgi:hypothetical protein
MTCVMVKRDYTHELTMLSIGKVSIILRHISFILYLRKSTFYDIQDSIRHFSWQTFTFYPMNVLLYIAIFKLLAIHPPSFGDQIIAMADRLLGKSYKAGVLGNNPPESLTIDTQYFDCVSFVETVIAMALEKNNYHQRTFSENVQLLRYRNGIIKDYSSRIHYFTEWLILAEKQGLGKNISLESGGVTRSKNIHFITQNKNKYPAIKDSVIFESIRKTEREISNLLIPFIPANMYLSVIPLLKNGDLVGFTSSRPGLDIVHTGFVKIINNKAHLMHASQKSGKVVITSETLLSYLKKANQVDGIIIFRLNPV